MRLGIRIGIAFAGFAIGVGVGLLLMERDPTPTAPPRLAVDPGAPLPALQPADPAPDELVLEPPVTRARFDALRAVAPPSGETAAGPLPLRQSFRTPESAPGIQGPISVQYTLDPALTEQVFRILERGKVALGHVLLMDVRTGRLLVYASTDVERFPGTRTYPAASLIKVVTAAASLHYARDMASRPCRYRGSPYRLTRSRVHPPRTGREMSLRRALALSNNQCFAQLAVHGLGADTLLQTIARFGLLSAPAPGHAAGHADAGEDALDLGRLGSGLAGTQITPLHAVQIAATLDRGLVIAPRWVDAIHDASGHPLALSDPGPPARVMTEHLAAELRDMLVDTTRRGTARSAFRTRRGHPLLGDVRVAGKTGSLSGRNPRGRYEWFAGVAPADAPRVAVAAVVVQRDLYWRTASQVAAETLKAAFCPRGVCSTDAVERWLRPEPAGPSALRVSSR